VLIGRRVVAPSWLSMPFMRDADGLLPSASTVGARSTSADAVRPVEPVDGAPVGAPGNSARPHTPWCIRQLAAALC